MPEPGPGTGALFNARCKTTADLNVSGLQSYYVGCRSVCGRHYSDCFPLVFGTRRGSGVGLSRPSRQRRVGDAAPAPTAPSNESTTRAQK